MVGYDYDIFERCEFMKPYGVFDDTNDFCPDSDHLYVSFDEAKITIPSGVSYIFMPKLRFSLGFVDQNYAPIIPVKDFSFDGVVGKLDKVTIN